MASKKESNLRQFYLKVYDKKGCPSFFAPEIYEKFKNKEEIDKQLSFYNSFEAVSILLKGFANFVFDFWSAGALFYEMIFDKEPFKILSLDSYENDLNDEMSYEMSTFCMTEKLEKLISGCLIYKMEKRLGGNLIEKMLRDLNKEKDNYKAILVNKVSNNNNNELLTINTLSVSDLCE